MESGHLGWVLSYGYSGIHRSARCQLVLPVLMDLLLVPEDNLT